MKRIPLLTCFALPLHLLAQDSTMNSLTKDMNVPTVQQKPAVKIFSSQRSILANTTEMVGAGKMDFKVTHYFDDIDGHGASVVSRFLGLDNARDVRIGFHFGITKNFDVMVARAKGAGAVTNNASGSVLRIFELAAKYRFMEQREKDPSHPLAIALFASNCISSVKATPPPNTNFENSFVTFADRMMQTVQLIIARKFGPISVQLNPTFVHTDFVVQGDENNMFALGGAVRLPLTPRFAFVVDYFHPFRSAESKQFFNTVDNNYNTNPNNGPIDLTINSVPFKFYDPLGLGVEITTAGHVFSLNFTNAVEILDNRFIRFTTKSWTKGQWRWCFTISRKFVIWRPKTA